MDTRRLRVAAASLTLIVLNACGSAPHPMESRSSEPSPVLVSSAAAASFDPADVAQWIRFRTTYGLRTDTAWVAQVASDPANTNEIDVPLTAAELSLVSSLNLSAELLAPELRKYGNLFPAEFAGVMIENPRVVIQFSGPLEAHRAAIRTLFGAAAPIDVRDAAYSVDELATFALKVESARAWFPTVGAALYQADSYELTNSVRVRYIAKDTSVEPLILAHFGDPTWMTVKWYGPPEWTGPRGDLRITVVDRARRPVDVECLPESLDPAVSANYLPLESGRDGICEFGGLASVAWRVGVSFEDHAGRSVNVSQNVLVPNGGTRDVQFAVDR